MDGLELRLMSPAPVPALERPGPEAAMRRLAMLCLEPMPAPVALPMDPNVLMVDIDSLGPILDKVGAEAGVGCGAGIEMPRMDVLPVSANGFIEGPRLGPPASADDMLVGGITTEGAEGLTAGGGGSWEYICFPVIPLLPYGA